MNHLLDLTKTKNRWFIMRHGQSIANCEGLIVSTPKNGICHYGLSQMGEQQVTNSIKHTALHDLNSSLQIISSDFKRAVETAQIAHQQLKAYTQITLDARLRERDFGDFELCSDTNYQIPWAHDGRNSAHTHDNVESADSVMQRATELVASLDKSTDDKSYLLVAHGDTLQILQTAFLKLSASKQREIRHLENAEIRELKLI